MAEFEMALADGADECVDGRDVLVDKLTMISIRRDGAQAV
jgi:hypothetical protein